jgi:endonuclease-3
LTISIDPQTQRAIQIVSILQIATKNMLQPASSHIIAEYGKNPYLVLISCLLSLRTKDIVSWPASRRLFLCATTPDQMLALPIHEIEMLIYPVGFYRRKALSMHTVSKVLLDRFGGQVPHTQEELLSIPGVGIKTANLVLAVAFDIPAICVDTHVHRISNRLGLVRTTTVEQTEQELMRVLPKELWADYSRLMVIWGQNICVPVSPFCSRCPLFDLCPKAGVGKKR